MLSPINYRDKRYLTVIKVSELIGAAEIYTKSCCNFKKSHYVLFSAAADSVNCSLFLKNLEKRMCNKLQNKTSSDTLKIYRYIYRKNLSITDIKINRYRPRLLGNYRFIVIALVQKSLSCPSLFTNYRHVPISPQRLRH